MKKVTKKDERSNTVELKFAQRMKPSERPDVVVITFGVSCCSLFTARLSRLPAHPREIENFLRICGFEYLLCGRISLMVTDSGIDMNSEKRFDNDNKQYPVEFRQPVPKLLEISLLRMATLLWHQTILNDWPWRQNMNELDAPLRYYEATLPTGTLPLSMNNFNVTYDISEYSTWSKSPRIHLLLSRIHDYVYKVNDLNIVSILKTRIPVILEQKIRRTASQVGIKMLNWIFIHFDVFVDRNEFEIVFVEYFDDLIWQYKGKPVICSEETAKRLMNRPKISAWHKFNLACEYCFVEQIVTMWPSVSTDTRINCFQLNMNSDQEMLHYWIHFLDHHRHPGAIEEDMIEFTEFFNRYSLEYFWNFVEPDRRVRKMISCLKSSFGPAYVSLLSTFDADQWKELMVSAGDQVIIYLIRESNSEFVAQVWRRFKHLVSGEQFIKIIWWIFEHEFQTISYYFTDNIRISMHSIWIEAPDRLKRRAIEELVVDDGFSQYHKLFPLSKLPRPMDFLILVLSDATFEQRNKIWIDNWKYLIYGTAPRFLNELMELCLQKDQIVEFKQREMMCFENIKKYCVELMKRTCRKELNTFLKFCCSSDSEHIADLERQISESWREYVFSYRYSRNLNLLD